jgi:microcin C transport system permease protein
MPLFRLNPLTQKRLRRFRRIKRGWWSLWILVVAYLVSLFAELFVGNRPLVVRYADHWYFPAVSRHYYPETMFGGALDTETEFRELKESPRFAAADGLMVFPLHPYSPLESVIVKGDPPPSHPTREHPFGTDDRGRDVLARVVYGFRISVTFALMVSIGTYIVGIALGAAQGFWGGWVDIVGQRLSEIWSALPFLYVVLLVSSVLEPGFIMLVGILVIFQWIGISRYTRAEVLRERTRDYVTAARAMGASSTRILFQHVIGNALTPAITLFPLSMVGDIFALTSLDFLGFGLPAPTPSWGELFKQAHTNWSSWWLVTFPFLALLLTLLLTTLVGESLREAWDPRDQRPAIQEDRRKRSPKPPARRAA